MNALMELFALVFTLRAFARGGNTTIQKILDQHGYEWRITGNGK